MKRPNTLNRDNLMSQFDVARAAKCHACGKAVNGNHPCIKRLGVVIDFKFGRGR